MSTDPTLRKRSLNFLCSTNRRFDPNLLNTGDPKLAEDGLRLDRQVNKALAGPSGKTAAAS
jgi:hypothetical protein